MLLEESRFVQDPAVEKELTVVPTLYLLVLSPEWQADARGALRHSSLENSLEWWPKGQSCLSGIRGTCSLRS